MNSDEREKRGRRLTLLDDMRRIVEASVGHEHLTVAQERDYGAAATEYNQLGRDLGIDPIEQRSALIGDRIAVLADEHRKMAQPVGDPPTRQIPGDASAGVSRYASARDPREVRKLTPSEKVSDLPPLHGDQVRSDASFGETLQAMVFGGRDLRAMGVGLGSTGGYAVPTQQANGIIDFARAKAVTLRAGAQTWVMDATELWAARLTGDAPSVWKGENALAAPSNMTLEGIRFRARTLFCWVRMSIELFEDALGIGELVQESIGHSLALELDRAALRGAGSGLEPLGILNQQNINTTALSTAVVNYDPFSNAAQTILAKNGNPSAAIYAPRTAAEIDKLRDTVGQPMKPTPLFQAMQQLTTTQIPINLIGGTASEIYVGDFSKLVFGMRTDFQLEVSREASNPAGSIIESAWTQGQVWIRAYLRADVGLLQPGHFSVTTDVR